MQHFPNKKATSIAFFWIYVTLQFTIPYRFSFLPLSIAAVFSFAFIFLVVTIYWWKLRFACWPFVAPVLASTIFNILLADSPDAGLFSAVLCSIIFVLTVFLFQECGLNWEKASRFIFAMFKTVLLVNIIFAVLQVSFGEIFFIAESFALTGGDYRIPVGIYDIPTTFSFLSGFMFLYCLSYSVSNGRYDTIMLFLCLLVPASLLMSGSRSAILALTICVAVWVISSATFTKVGRIYVFGLAIGTMISTAFLCSQGVNFPAAEVVRFKYCFSVLEFLRFLGLPSEIFGPYFSGPMGGQSLLIDDSSLERWGIYIWYFDYLRNAGANAIFGVNSYMVNGNEQPPNVPHNSLLQLVYLGGYSLLLGFLYLCVHFLHRRYWVNLFFVPVLYLLLVGLFWDIYLARWLWLGWAFLLVEHSWNIASRTK